MVRPARVSSHGLANKLLLRRPNKWLDFAYLDFAVFLWKGLSSESATISGFWKSSCFFLMKDYFHSKSSPGNALSSKFGKAYWALVWALREIVSSSDRSVTGLKLVLDNLWKLLSSLRSFSDIWKINEGFSMPVKIKLQGFARMPLKVPVVKHLIAVRYSSQWFQLLWSIMSAH